MTSRPFSFARAVLFCTVFIPAAVRAQQLSAPDVSELALPPGAVDLSGPIAPQLLKAKGKVQVWVQLQESPLAAAQADAEDSGLPLTREAQRAHLAKLEDQHDELSFTARSLGAEELGRVSRAHNAVAFSIDAAKLPALAAQRGVLAIRPVIDYTLDLSETVPYIGATAVQNAGVTGEGVRVAVLDTGIDYTHRNLRGSGTAADYTKAYGTSLDDPRNRTIDPTVFPTSKVVGGFDFVGEHWPSGPRTEDPNPIDCGGPIAALAPPENCSGGHGSHVADIIGGSSRDGTHKGVAPGTKLLALKVCSSVSNACSGIALLKAMDFAIDPDRDGDVSDHVDVINMSLGRAYGQIEDDLTLASENAVRLGVVVVTAAGNSGDKPYVVSFPSIGPGVISVAQTQVPSAKFFPLVINSPPSIAGRYNNTATVGWAPIGSGFTGDVVFVGRGCPGDTYLANPAGKVALINRGACNVSLKTDRAAKAGAIGVLIAMVNAADPISFSFGGGTKFVPTLVIRKAEGDKIRGVPVANVTVHDSEPLVKSIVGSSARGPSYSFQTIKPEIGAPGASVSAECGTGTGETSFGGTSGATPMVAGSAALLLQAHPGATPAEIKARLMNTAETGILTAPNLFGSQVAPATRIGAGEVRVDRALATKTIAWVASSESAAVSFGYAAVAQERDFHKKVLVYNFSKSSRTYAVSMTLRDPANQAAAAVQTEVPKSIRVPGRSLRALDVQISIDPTKLPTWSLNGGPQGGNGALLTALELDGTITLHDAIDTIHLPWQVLAHKAADVRAEEDEVELHAGTGSLELTNQGATAGRVDLFSWTGSSPKIPRQLLPGPGDNFAVINLGQVGVRLINVGSSPAVQFGINTFGRRSHPNYPAEFDVAINANADFTQGYLVFNGELGGFDASGQNVSTVVNLATGKTTTKFFTDADLNSANVIMTALLADVGLTSTSQFKFSIFAFDNYFTGNQTDAILNMTYTLAQPRFIATGIPAGGVPVGGSSVLTVSAVAGGDTASPSQKGVLLLSRDAARREALPIRVHAENEQDRN
jgi:subtilisin family serine protease